MTLRRFALVQTPAARAGAGLALLALIGVGIATANTEAVVAGRFTAALESAPRQVVADRTGDRTLVSGSEAYWLAEKRRHDSGAALEPAAWSAAPFAANVAVGDRITISSAEKGERILEVVTITDVEPVSETAGHARTLRRIVVTCRDMSSPDKRLVTFEIPVETDPGALKSARAL